MKKMWIVVVVITTFVGFCGCEKEPVAKGGGGDLQGGEENSLLGTKWKLVGFFDVEKNELTEAEPKECNECYVLEFQTDSTFLTFSSSNELYGKYTINKETCDFKIIHFGGTKAGESGNGNLYANTFWNRTLHFLLFKAAN